MQSLRNIQQQLVRSFGEQAAGGLLVRLSPRQAPEAEALRGALRPEGVEALVRSALLTGRISSALTQLHELREAKGPEVFEEFRVTAGRREVEEGMWQHMIG